jgi:TonB family protein
LPLSQLSKKPVPPALAQALERNYPPEARNLGRSGEAKVRARIEANGAIRNAKVTSETAPGFGAACRNTLLSSQWSVPLDHDGKPVATWISYQCKFRIER